MHLTIAIIEDEQPARERIGELVIQELSGETEVYIEKYEDAEHFLKALEEKKDTAYPDVVISDIDLPGMNGIELGAKLKGDGIETNISRISDVFCRICGRQLYTGGLSVYSEAGYERSTRRCAPGDCEGKANERTGFPVGWRS